jgi:hypothetical protein
MRLKSKAPILIIGIGLIISYLIVKNPLKNIEWVPLLNRQSTVQPQSQPTTQETIFPFKKITENIFGNIKTESLPEPQSQPSENSSTENNQNSDNISDNLTAILAQKIAENNPEGPIQQNGQTGINVPNAETATQDLLGQALANSDFTFDIPVIEENLKISQNNSLAAQTEYLKNIKQITDRNFSNFKKTDSDILSDVFEKSDFSSAQRAIEIYKSLVSDYYNLSVPSLWLDFHENAISHFQKAASVYQAILDYNNDPLKAYIAAETVTQLEISAQENQTLLEEKIKTLQSAS